MKALADAQRFADSASDGEPVWPWVFRLDDAKIASYRAVAASRLGVAEIAATAFDRAEAARSPKQAAFVAAEHARALAAGGRMDQACALAIAAYDIGCSYESERVRQAVCSFRASLNVRTRQCPVAELAELDDRLRADYAARAT